MYHLSYRRILLQIFFCCFTVTGAAAQNSDPDSGLSVNVSIAPDFDAVNIENLITLTFSSLNEKPVVNYEIANNRSSGTARFLIETFIRSENEGLILRSSQNPNTVFEMDAGEILRFSNLDIIRGTIPGQSGDVKFDFVLTNRGRQLLSRLNEGAVVDEDRFYVDVRILPEDDYQAEPVASSSAEIETSVPDVYLEIRGHGPTLNALSALESTDNLPSLRWVAPQNQRYRLILASVDESSGAAENVLENRFRSEFNPRSVTDLRENILLDVLVDETEFQVPGAIEQQLVPGNDYVWQVGAEIATLKQTMQVKSDVWRFTIPEPDTVNEELISILSEILGEDKVDDMVNQGYELQQVELGGEVYSAEEAVVILREMLQKIRNRRATIGE
ncbi:hypothetical protein [Rhodohalobacter mucosus]|uniref:Uncharacterized protein n=1 Tax=Rhodohalobacter mucosus TaxID=2079485 RepID=A0A316TQP2_9BACT|nr:hypothetical protein [Rhodohalobacter mucosus]PWN05335.1 hypothetical protein DDZ15_14810 [Rhodohalobacter mucosus]